MPDRQVSGEKDLKRPASGAAAFSEEHAAAFWSGLKGCEGVKALAAGKCRRSATHQSRTGCRRLVKAKAIQIPERFLPDILF